ncbi:Ribosomal RNA small subunit methyltransferase A [bacterium HR12]|nr:Ribosomal RNA small subunit methyltransferase A [bacterium HR12]
MADADVRPGDRVLEVGPGLGSLTVALAAAGARVLAVELDRALLPALAEVLAPWPSVRVIHADALRAPWDELLGGGAWTMVSNLPYNVAVPVVLRMLEEAPQVRSLLVMVQREVGERLVARAGEPAYGAASVRVAYHAEGRLVRRVPARVFWPEPAVDSVLVRLVRRSRPPVSVPRERLFAVVEAGFAERRKTMRAALRKLGLAPEAAVRALERCGLPADVRAERLALEDFARLAETVEAA